MIPKLVKVLIIAAIVLGLALGTIAGSVSAAQGTVPGALLYGVKLGAENLQLLTQGDPEAGASLAMTMAQERVEEAVKLAEGGQEIPESLAERYKEQLTLALQNLGEVTGEAQQMQLKAGIEQALAVQTQAMTQLMTQLKLKNGECEDECPVGPIQTMLQAGELVRNRVGQPEGTGQVRANAPITDDVAATEDETPPQTGPIGPIRAGKAFDDEEFEPTGPFGPARGEGAAPGAGGKYGNPDAPFGPNDGPGVGVHDGNNNSGPNGMPDQANPNDQAGGNNGNPNGNSGGRNGGGNGGGGNGGH